MRWILMCLFATATIQAENEIAMNEKQQKVSKYEMLLYYSPSCPHSNKVINYLGSIRKKVPMKNVKGNQAAIQELFEKGGIKQVPMLLVNDEPIYGDDEIIEWLKDHKDEY